LPIFKHGEEQHCCCSESERSLRGSLISKHGEEQPCCCSESERPQRGSLIKACKIKEQLIGGSPQLSSWGLMHAPAMRAYVRTPTPCFVRARVQAKQRAAIELQRVEAVANARAEAAERKAAEALAELEKARRHAAAADAELAAADSEAEVGGLDGARGG